MGDRGRVPVMKAVMGTRIEVSNDELKTVRDATRELGKLIESLESGAAEKFVLTKHGQMCAVVVSLEEFAALSAPESEQGETD